MAYGGCNGDARNDVVELEAMRGDSFSWHPCQVSLCSKGLGLIVQYGDNYVEEIMADKEGVLARIRVRSTPLEGDGCSFVQQGDHVLATQNSHVKGVFYDARVEEVSRVRHSKRIHCRCSFTIKWLHEALKGETLTVPASAIMKLATESINVHPTISTFFSMLESSNDLDTLPSSTIFDSMNWEMDINILLEKQIEEIKNSTDVPRKKISKNFLSGLKVDFIGHSLGSPIDASLKDPCVTIPSVPEEFTGSRSPLNPLAARAALASLRSNFPQNSELSIHRNVKKVLDDFSLEGSATLGDISPKFEGIVKTLFPASNAPQTAEFPNVSSRTKVKSIERKNKNSGKEISPPSETRFTRSQIQRNNGTCESAQMTNTKEKELKLSPKTRKVTNRAEKTETEECNGAVEENTTTEVDSRKGNFTENTEKRNCAKRLTRSAAREETVKNNVQSQDLFEGNVSTVATNISEQVTEERGKKRGTSTHVKSAPNSAESGVAKSQGSKRKSASSKNQETRFSPRLRDLRSQS